VTATESDTIHTAFLQDTVIISDAETILTTSSQDTGHKLRKWATCYRSQKRKYTLSPFQHWTQPKVT